MGRFDGVLLASDYDGTLVPSDKKVTPEVAAAIRYFMEQGGFFTVSTGRTYQGFPSYSPEIINAPVLLANGGMAYDYAAGKIAFSDGIGAEGIPALRGVRDNFPSLSIEMYAFDDTYAINLSDATHRHFTSQGIPYKVIADPSEAVLPWAKAMLFGERGEIAAAQVFLRENHPEAAFLPNAGGCLEILKPGVDKGSALLKLAALLGVSKEDVYAAGDGYNDKEMLAAAAASFVPENGDGEMKAMADYIVGSNEESCIADAIEILKGIYK